MGGQRPIDRTSVTVKLSSAEPDIPFLSMILEEERRTGAPVPLDSLIALSRLRQERRLSVADAATALQKDEAAARAVLERLVESGLVEARGIKKGRIYTLSAGLPRYRAKRRLRAAGGL